MKEEKKNNLKKIEHRLNVLNVFLVLMFMATNVYAASDPLSVINNLSNFIFGVIRAIGLIITGMSIVQLGLSFKSHDPSQRANGFMGLAGGIIITFAKEILNTIIG